VEFFLSKKIIYDNHHNYDIMISKYLSVIIFSSQGNISELSTHIAGSI